MELTKANLEKGLEAISKIYSDKQSCEALIDRWNEKGVECSIVMPILEVIMGFDPVFDIKFEASSQEFNRQRMDFVLCGSFVVEAKSMSEELSKHYSQLVDKYMKNKGVDCAMITNGVFFDFFIRVDPDVADKIRSKIGGKDSIRVASITYINDVSDFIDIISIFSKDRYRDTISKINSYVKAILKFEGYGKNIKIGIDRKDLDKEFKKMIEDNVVGRRGMFWDSITAGDIAPGDKFCLDCYDDEGYKIVFEVDKNGMLVIVPGECDYQPMKIDSDKLQHVQDLFLKWKAGTSLLYVHYKDIIKDIRGLTNRPRKDYNYFKI